MKGDKRVGLFTEKETKWIIDRLGQVWDEIWPDMFLDDHGKYDESKTIPRDEVYEVFADRLDTGAGLTNEDREIVNKYWTTPHAHVEKQAIKTKAFPYALYGT